MSKRKIAYARKNAIDPEEEGEELPFEPRQITIHTDYWFDRDYELYDELLGRGKFGEVKKCCERSSGMVLAAKIVTARKQKEKEDVRKEIKIMSQLRHPKILQVYDAFESPKKMCIITELVEGGELFDRVVDEKFDLTERVAILFMRQIIDGIAFIHSQNILHLDMKPENIICVAKTGTRIKIIDFGLATRYDSFSSTKVMAGTVDFMSPEVCNYEEVTPATDMWSIGVICYVLVSGLSPFCGDDDADTICNILKIDFDFAAEEFDEVTAGCKDFIKKLLIKDHRKRMSALDCMKHSWLNKITRSQTNKHLSKKHHIKFFVKRKWKKVIKAVIALNRFTRLARERREASETRTLPQPAVAESCEIPDWRVRMEERISQGRAKAEMINSKKSTEGLSKQTNAGMVASGPVTSSLSCSSGYDSSGSTRSTATIDDIPLVSADELEKSRNDSDDIVAFQRLESVETLVNDDTKVSDNVIQDSIDTASSAPLQPVTDDESATNPNVDDHTTQATGEVVTERQQSEAVDEDMNSSEDDEVYNFYSDSEEEVNDSDVVDSQQTDTHDRLSRTDSESSGQTKLDISPKQSADSNFLSQVHADKGECGNNSSVGKNTLFQPVLSNDDKDLTNTAGRGSPGGSRLQRRRASLLEDVIEFSEDAYPVQRSGSRRSSRVDSGDVRDLSNRSDSPGVREVGHTSRSEIPRYDRSRKSSTVEIGSPRGSNHSTQHGKRGPSPATRYSRRSRNNSREPSIDQDLDDFTPVGRHHYWSPSPVRELSSDRQRRMRMAALGGEEYTPFSVYDSTERIIPIQVEHSPPRAETRYRSLPRQGSSSSMHSDNFAPTRSSQYDPTVRTRWSSNPAVDADDVYSMPFRVRDSPVRDPGMFLSRVRESPGRNSLDRRQARIAAIMGDSTESLDSVDRRKPPSAGFPSNRSYSGSSTENRQARIATIMNNNDFNSPKEGSRQTCSVPSSRTNSEDDRHRRIAAILSKKDNS